MHDGTNLTEIYSQCHISFSPVYLPFNSYKTDCTIYQMLKHGGRFLFYTTRHVNKKLPLKN